MADPTTEAGEPPQCVLGTLFPQGRRYLDFSRKWVGGDTGGPLLWGSAIKASGTAMVYNGADSKIPEGQGALSGPLPGWRHSC